VCANYDLRFVRQENQGTSAARNTGLALARGRYIALLDHDDRWYPDRLRRGIEALDADPSCLMVYSEMDEIDVTGEIALRHFLKNHVGGHPKRSLAECLAADMNIYPSAVLLRREVCAELGGFDTRLQGYEDDDYFIRVYERGPICYIEEPLVQWRWHGNNDSISPNMPNSRRVYMRKLLARYPDRPDAGEYLSRHYIAPRFLKDCTAEYLRSLNPTTARIPPELAQGELRFLLPYLRHPSLTLRLAVYTPVWLLRPLVTLWRRAPVSRAVRERAWYAVLARLRRPDPVGAAS
jgi:glycosyltransferase involved in cell wall biosynthesis